MLSNGPIDAQFDVQPGSQDFVKKVAQSKRIELHYSLVEAGRATFPPGGDFSDLLKLFPSIIGVDVFPPYLIIRVKVVPPRPWPLTIGGLPVQFTTDKWAEVFHRGRSGRGHRVLTHLNLHTTIDYSQHVLRQAVRVFREMKIMIRDIFWFGGFWQITIPDGTDIKLLPTFIAASPAFYRTISEAPEPDPATLKNKTPQGVEYDDNVYTTAPNALLRPGIMLSSSTRTITTNGVSEEICKSTTSGILVANLKGEIFITVATHGFEEDGLVYHPNPQTGTVIGQIVDSLPGTDISIAKLNPGLRYVNEAFGTSDEPRGTRMNGYVPPHPPHLRAHDDVTMNNPYSGSCEGVIIGLGAKIPEEGDKEYVAHEWVEFENGEEPFDGSCGSPIINAEGNVVGLFRFKMANSSLCLTVSATELREFGYEICGGEQSFT